MNQPFRQQDAGIPLITWMAGAVFAIHPFTGARQWEQKLDASVERIVTTDRALVIVTRGTNAEDLSNIHFFDLASGHPFGKIEAPFRITTAIRHVDLLIFGGASGTLALRLDGTLVWSAALEVMKESAWSIEYDLVARDAGGRELWREQNRRSRGGALAIGDQLAQHDFS